MEAYLSRAQETIPAEVRMISGCKDEQTSADVSNVNSFQLPDPAGKAGGACTAALLKVLYADHTKPDADLSFQEVLLKLRDVLAAGQYSQIPQLSASRPLNVAHKFDLVPDNFSGTKRAVLIGINYVGDNPGELSGCHNDVLNMKVSLCVCVCARERETTAMMMMTGMNMSSSCRESLFRFLTRFLYKR